MLPDKHYTEVNLSGSFCLGTASLAPVAYFRILANAAEVLLDQQEFFARKSLHNRYLVLTANGVMTLTIPVEKISGGKCPVRDVRIATHGNWQQQHWRTLESAYRSGPFFEYYADDLVPFFEKKWHFLWDFNQEIQQKLIELIDFEPIISFTDEMTELNRSEMQDFRPAFQQEKLNSVIEGRPYYQVFSHKTGFVPNLSIIDLLFNVGTESILYLKNS